MEKGFCNVSGCDSQDFSFWLYDGQQFCKDHYNEKFFSDLLSHYEAWDGVTEPADRLKYLIGRYFSEHETAFVGKPSLTKAIVHERSFDWIKDGDCVIFTVIRHPVDRKLGYPNCFEIHQSWKFNTKMLTFSFLSEEKVA